MVWNMSGEDRVRQWFESGRLVHPSSGEHGFVDLVQAIRIIGGAEDGLADGRATTLASLVGEARHLVFVLVDGLGAELVETLAFTSFLRGNLTRTLRAVFPATTASALTTLATGLWPGDHCIPGWWTRLPREALSAVTLLFTERASGEPLSRFGVEPATLYPVPGFWPSLDFAAHSILPAEIAGSVFAGYLSGGTTRLPYTNLDQAMSLVESVVRGADEPAFIYVYLPHLDTLLHGAGSADPRVGELLVDIDRRLGRLAAALSSHARLVVCSDHGLVDVPEERVVVIPADDPLARHLQCPPTGEPSVPVFHLLQGHEAAFAEAFAERLGDLFALVSVEEAQALKLYGPWKLAPEMRERLGSFIGIAPRPAKLYLEPIGSSAKHRAIHGGLRSSEMLIPLIVA
jgi:hypothetical protein